MNFKTCAVIPVYNHHACLEQIAVRLHACGLACIFVDDGSDATTKTVLRDIVSSGTDVECLTLASNQGKGAAVLAGFGRAAERGCTRVLQVDADGQHDLDDIPALLKLAEAHPDKLISGLPVFDESVPRARFYGRYLTHVLVWIETLSLQLRDSMCGFRIYPLVPSLMLTRQVQIGRRMDFDTDIMVRLFWSGVETMFMPTRVRYPQDGISHFRLLADNARMTWMHIRLLFGMLLRIPTLFYRNLRRERYRHWAHIGERGSLLGLRIIGFMDRRLGRHVSHVILYPVTAYFYFTQPRARRASRQFLTAAGVRPSLRASFRHFMHFSISILDAVAAWHDPTRIAVRFPDLDVLSAAVSAGHGALLISAHLGNPELARALASMIPELRINALVYTRHVQKLNSMFEETNKVYRVRLIEVQEIGPDTVVMLRKQVAAGEVIVIVGDRTPVSAASPVVQAEFLGRPAPFPVGPYVLGHVLECPVYLFFCMQEGDGYTVYLEPFAEGIRLPRRERMAALQVLADRYAARLADYAARFPLQWYNFYDFWADRRLEVSRLRGVTRPKTDTHGQGSQTLA